jgi:hypothetical protein
MYANPSMPQMQPMLGSSHYPPTFSYAQPVAHAQHQGGALFGNELISGGIGATRGVIQAAQMGVMGAGLINAGSSGLTALGLMKAPVLASSLIGTGASSGLAMGLVGGPVGLGLMGAGAVASTAMHGVQNANQVGALFGNMQFANGAGDPSTGRGFSQRDLMTLQRGIRAIDTNNPFVSMSDAMRAADRFTEMGMHQGIQDAEKLAKKVTQLGKTMHAMARQLGTSMEEAGTFLKDMRGAGFYSAQDVMGNTSNMTLMRGFGMSSDQFAGMQRMGAGMTRSAMMSGKSGAGVVTAKTAEFMSAIRSGAMDANQMMDMTGASTPLEAAQMLAQQTLSGTMQGLSGGLGTAMLLAAGTTDSSGKFTGKVDADMLRRMSSGQMSRDEMLQVGGRKRDSREGQASFMARKQDITESMLESDMGQEALFGMIRSLTEQQFGAGKGDDQDLFQLVAETQLNMDRRTVRNLQKLRDTRAQRMKDLAREARTNERAADLKENASLAGIYQKVTGTLSDAYESAAMPFSEYYRDVTGGLQDIERRILGVTEMSGISASGLEEAMLSSTRTSAQGGVAFGSGSKLSIGEAARLAAVQNNPSIMRNSLPGVTDATSAAFKKSGVNLTNEIALLREKGGTLNDPAARNRLAVKLGLAREITSIKDGGATGVTQYDRDQLYSLIAKEGGDLGAKMAAEANVDRVEKGDKLQGIAAAQAEMQNALGMQDIVLSSDSVGGKSIIAAGASTGVAAAPSGFGVIGAAVGAGLAALGVAFNSDEEEAIRSAAQGEGLGLMKAYGTSSKEIDGILQGRTTPAEFDEAAKIINKRFGLKITGAELKQANLALTQAHGGKTATERLSNPDSKVSERIGKAAAAVESGVSREKIKEGLSELRGAARRAGVDVSMEDDETALGQSISELAKKGFDASDSADATTRTLSLGVDVFNQLEGAKGGGFTLAEIKAATGLEAEQATKLLTNLGAAVGQDGSVSGRDISTLQKGLAAAVTKGVQVSEGREQILNSGMSEIERQSLSVYRTAEMVDGLWQKLKDDNIIKSTKPDE